MSTVLSSSYARALARVRVASLIVCLFAALLAIAAPTRSATNPGSNGKMTFTRSNQIYVRPSTATGSVTQLTTAGKNYWPKWSPDPKRIAYTDESTTGSRDIWIMSAAGAS